MKSITLWLLLGWENVFIRLLVLFDKLRLMSSRASCLFLRHIDYRRIFYLSHVGRFLRLTSHDTRMRTAVAHANKKCLLDDGKKLNYTWQTQRRKWLVKAVTYGQNPRALRELAECTAQLNAVVEPLHQQGHAVMLAPLHMVSDVLTTMVAAGVYPHKATVITSISANAHPEEERRTLGGLDLSYCSIHDDNKSMAGNLMSAVMEAAERKRNIILFPDITPDFTHTANKDSAAKFSCRILGRPAKLHSGIIRLSRVMSAQVVFYHLYFDDGIRIKIHPPVPAKKIKEMMPGIIEQSIREHSTDWMLWHAHSLFFINE